MDGDDLGAEHAAGLGFGCCSLWRDTAQRLAANSRWEYENLPYWGGEVDCCINAFTVANGAWLGADVSGIVVLVPGAPHDRRRLELRVGRGFDACRRSIRP